jgi:hypothetical protein
MSKSPLKGSSGSKKSNETSDSDSDVDLVVEPTEPVRKKTLADEAKGLGKN